MKIKLFTSQNIRRQETQSDKEQNKDFVKEEFKRYAKSWREEFEIAVKFEVYCKRKNCLT